MRVKQLIEQLQKCDPNSEVIVLCCDDNPLNGDGIDIKRVLAIDYVESGVETVYIDSTVD
ncbi:MAG: hypothetical protein ACI4Q6_06735 [Huintestinicola sp.]